MKAVDANLLDLLKKATQFVVPIYQRIYSWDYPECEQLWKDILRAGSSDSIGAHFTGSIVYVERDQGNIAQAEPALIIDGQQRVTTVTLLLAAMAAHLETLPDAEQEPVEGFSPSKIRGLWLTNPYESGDKFFKLILSQNDKEALKAVVRNDPLPADSTSRVITNFQYFVSQLKNPTTDIAAVCTGISKLVVVDVHLARGVDNPQLVFEAMNSTGKRLSQADLIRNFVLMDLEPSQQTRLYEGYWFPMESDFSGAHEARFDEFARHYLTLKTGTTPRFGDIYEAFKEYTFGQEGDGVPREQIVVDLAQYARWFVAMAHGKETDAVLRSVFAEIEQLRATVVYPFTLRLYADYASGVLPKDDFVRIMRDVVSYLFRRAICRIPTNSLMLTFAKFAEGIDPENYVESVEARFLSLATYKRFPTDDEFAEALRTEDLYHIQRAPYLFRTLENHGRKEEVSIADYTIEHIMPQNESLSGEWQQALGENWQDVHNRLLHTLGNLTLTGYNPELSDRPFTEKRDMEGGFKNSPLRLNQGLGELDTWNEAEIVKRAGVLAEQALGIWRRPQLPGEVVEKYGSKLTQPVGFDWTLTHDILEAIPAGRWTAYHHLAEAVGTAAQAIGNHVPACTTCAHPYRVLTWDGRVADKFSWPDPDDPRDPRQLLEDEGVRFIDGLADPSQELNAEDLLALVEDDS